MIKFLLDILTGIDNKTISSKKVAGWISLIAFLTFAYLEKPEHVLYSTLGLVVSFFGFTSLDYSILKPKPPVTE